MHTVKVYGTVEIQLHTFLTSPADGCKWLASRPREWTSQYLLIHEAGRAPDLVWMIRRREKSLTPARNQTVASFPPCNLTTNTECPAQDPSVYQNCFNSILHKACAKWKFWIAMTHVFHNSTNLYRGTAVAQWLRCCATNRKVAGSIPAGVSGIFHWHKILPIALWPWGWLSL